MYMYIAVVSAQSWANANIFTRPPTSSGIKLFTQRSACEKAHRGLADQTYAVGLYINSTIYVCKSTLQLLPTEDCVRGRLRMVVDFP